MNLKTHNAIVIKILCQKISYQLTEAINYKSDNLHPDLGGPTYFLSLAG